MKMVTRASEIAIQKFLEFRKNQAAVALMHTANIKMESNNLATVIIAALIDAGLINEQSRSYAFEIAAEEILVRRSMEQLR